ncbi:ribbon-helix-helix domain-containing protein [Planktothrix agardhii]|jgi:hypothetical protein|uniref:ribbon-helix-helix domain-containing protein n=2 Tax=Planktothrix agardhii TaxID=1160 RepID=UPI0028754931|nr:hypothetical protein [Planktothrix agardhii]MDS1347695.1 hypothetical protein [Planktothrix agardhii NRERC-751]
MYMVTGRLAQLDPIPLFTKINTNATHNYSYTSHICVIIESIAIKAVSYLSRFINSDMSKRIQVTLPDQIATDLEKLAHSQGRSVSNLAAHLLEKALNEARQQGLSKNEDQTST